MVPSFFPTVTAPPPKLNNLLWCFHDQHVRWVHSDSFFTPSPFSHRHLATES